VKEMKEFIITTDTTCDLPDEYIREHNIRIIPLYYSFDDTVYGDKNQLNPKDFYNKMRGGSMPTTMAANPDTAKDIFLELLDKGYDILHISFSSALSGSCSVVNTVARDLCNYNPDANIKVVDSLCASMGEGLLVHKAVQMKEAGKSMDDIFDWLEENKLNLCHIFTVDDLHHLHRGGRLSKTTAIIGTLINVKPVLHVNNEGRLVPLNNVRGRKKSLISLVNQMEKRISGFEDKNYTVFISHGDSLEDAEYVASLVRERFGVENIVINYICPTIGSHSGPGTIALFFMGNPR
jgi:DegV family protein with EDD domain